jgi:hypothetical protein
LFGQLLSELIDAGGPQALPSAIVFARNGGGDASLGHGLFSVDIFEIWRGRWQFLANYPQAGSGPIVPHCGRLVLPSGRIFAIIAGFPDSS